MTPLQPKTTRIDGHTVEALPPADTTFSYICRDCGGHAHELSDYRGDPCVDD